MASSNQRSRLSRQAAEFFGLKRNLVVLLVATFVIGAGEELWIRFIPKYLQVLGATIFVIAQNYLQEAMKAFSESMKGLPLLPDLFHPDRWLLWLGVLFVLSVYYFPHGIVGQLRAAVKKPSAKK